MADGDDLVIGEMNTTSNSTTKLYQDPPHGEAFGGVGVLGHSANGIAVRRKRMASSPL